MQEMHVSPPHPSILPTPQAFLNFPPKEKNIQPPPPPPPPMAQEIKNCLQAAQRTVRKYKNLAATTMPSMKEKQTDSTPGLIKDGLSPLSVTTLFFKRLQVCVSYTYEWNVTLLKDQLTVVSEDFYLGGQKAIV